MKTTNPQRLFLLFFCLTGLAFFGLSSRSQAATELVASPKTFPFTIHKQNFPYTTPFLITDLREDIPPTMLYSNKESFNIRTLNVYRAQSSQGLLENQPVVVFVHGGGWTDGYMDWYEYVSWPFTGEKGWVTVVIDYRLTSDQVFIADEHCPDRATCSQPANVVLRTKAAEYPANIADVAAALDWVVKNIANYGGDPHKIVVIGHSAGVHLATLLVTHPTYAELRSSIRGWVSLSGAYALDKANFKTAYVSLLGQTFGLPLIDSKLQDASPDTHIALDTHYPSAYLLYCEADLPLFAEQTTLFANTLQTHGVPYRLSYLAGYTHNSEMSAIQDINETPTQWIVEFIEGLLYPRIFLPAVAK